MMSGRWRMAPNTYLSSREGAAVVLDAAHGRYFGLNAMGTVILTEIERGAALEEVIDTICREYGMVKQTVATDVSTFAQKLASKRLIMRDEGDE